jgi:hypothetical protein
LADAGFVCVYVLLYGYAAYFAWRLAGGVAPIEDFFRIHFYLSGLIKLSQTAFYIMARGLLRSDRALSDEVMSNVYRGDLLWLTTNVARLSGYPIFQLFVLVLLCGWIATLIWLLIGWGAYRELTGLTRSRSLLAFLIFCILCVPVYILTTLISAALVS